MASNHRLLYKTPSTTFPTSLPLGNGRLAASVMSSPRCESFILNEITFWSGAPHLAGSGLSSRPVNPKAELRQTQQCLLDGNFAEAQLRAERYLESTKRNFGTNLPVGRLDMIIEGPADVSDFQRELLFDEAVATTDYRSNGYEFQRKSFVSHAHQVLAVIFETSDESGLKLAITFQGENDAFNTNFRESKLEFTTHALENVHSDGTCGVRGHGVIAAIVDEGTVEHQDGRLVVSAQKRITVLVAFNTDYKQADDNWKNEAFFRIEEALKLSTIDLLAAHVTDYQPLYRRTSLTLGPTSESQSNKVTIERRESLKSPDFNNDPGIYALYFHYARYLTIAGTRDDSPLPLHLQGLWNDGEACRMGWSCDYHLDINTQMNYYPTIPSGLADLMQPLVTYLDTLASAGRGAAHECYGCNGWVAHVFSNAWDFADPGWEITYGLNVTGGLWMASHLIELYEYTLDQQFLKNTAYPILKGAAEFFLDYMIEDPKTGWLLTAPSISPENSFFVEVNGSGRQEHCIHLSPTLDVVLLRDLFNFCLHASNLLQVDSDLAQIIKGAIQKLPPFQVGQHAQFQEWLQDFEEAQPYHRHLSHTMAISRSAQVSLRHTPDLARAISVSLDRRQDCDDLEDIEFTAALFGLTYARLGDADKALEQVGHLVSELSFDNLLSYSKPGVAGAEENIFVVDGNFGGAAVIMEMLARSIIPDLGGPVEVDLLPALPTSWSEGTAYSLRLRGNLELDLRWSNGILEKATIRASSDGALLMHYGSNCFKTQYKARDTIELGSSLQLLL